MQIKTMKIIGGIALALACAGAEAMPTKAELKQVQGAVNELMADDIAAMKAGKMKPSEVAKDAEKFADEATDEASKFLFYKGAFGLYVQGGSYDEAVKALEKMCKNVRDVPDKVVADIVRDKLKRISRKNGGAIFALYDRLDRRIRFAGEIDALEKKAKAAPSDKDVRRQLAIARVQIGAWPEALKDFAALGGKEAAAVADEAKRPAAAADFWWDYVSEEELKEPFREHAAALYRQAVAAGSVKGIQLSLAKKRMQEYEGAAAAEAAPVAEEASVQSQEAEPSSQRAQVAPAAKKGAAAVGGLKPIVIPLKGKGVRPLTFMPIPAGEGYKGFFRANRGAFAYTKMSITRPFLMAKLPIDHAQWEAIMGSPHEEAIGLPRLSDEAVAAYKAVGGDKAVAARNRHGEIFDLAERLNKNYRKFLPKGMVFRLPTFAEYQYVQIGGRQDVTLDTLYTLASMNEIPDDFAWFAAETLRLPDYVAVLKKAGLKVPEIDVKKGWQDPWLCAFGRLTPTGLKAPNPYGICDMNLAAEFLDCFGPESLPKNARMSDKAATDFISREFDSSIAGTEDPLYYSESADRYNAWGGGKFWSVYPKRLDVPANCTMRIVIGPDLVGEWKARQKK